MAYHHYVPQFYMRNFKIEGSNSSVFVYQRGKSPERRSTARIAGRNNLNNYTDAEGNINRELEGIFSRIEDKAVPLIARIIQTGKSGFNEEERADLAYFISTLHTRNMAFREKSKAQYIAMAKRLMKLQAENKRGFTEAAKAIGAKITEEEAEKARELFLEGKYDLTFENDDYFLRESLRLANEIYFYIFKKDWHILVPATGKYFVTSDNPLTVHRPINYHPLLGNGGIANGVLTLPISPSHTIMLVNEGSPPPDTILSDAVVDDLNSKVAFYTDRLLLSHVESRATEAMLNATEEHDGQAISVTYAGKTETFKPPKHER